MINTEEEREEELATNRIICNLGGSVLPERYSLADLEKTPTISQGHTDNLKADSTWRGMRTKVWLSRMTQADGMPYDNQVTVECYSSAWYTIDEYEAT